MTIEQAYIQLQNFGYDVLTYLGTLQVEEHNRIESKKITVKEIYAALWYQVDIENIRQVDDWTITIVF